MSTGTQQKVERARKRLEELEEKYKTWSDKYGATINLLAMTDKERKEYEKVKRIVEQEKEKEPLKIEKTVGEVQKGLDEQVELADETIFDPLSGPDFEKFMDEPIAEDVPLSGPDPDFEEFMDDDDDEPEPPEPFEWDDDDDDWIPSAQLPPDAVDPDIESTWPEDEMVGNPEPFVGASEMVGPQPNRPDMPIHPMQTPRLEDFIKITGMPMEINLQDFLNGIMNRKEQETGIIDNKDPTDVVHANIVYTRFNPMPSRKQIKKRVSLATLNNLRPYLTTIYAKNWRTMPNYISDAVVSQEGFEMTAQFLGVPISINALRIDSIWGQTTQRGKTTTFTLD